MKKLILICLLALIYTSTLAQYDETFSNDWGNWENARDFKGIKFRIRSNYVKGLNYKSVEIQFKNDYDRGVYFHYYAQDSKGEQNQINEESDWKIMMLGKKQSEQGHYIKMKYDEESLDIYIGGVFFSNSAKSEFPQRSENYSYTNPELNLDLSDKELCLFCTLFKDDFFCPKGGTDANVSNPWSANGTANLGRIISRTQADANRASSQELAQSPVGTAAVVGASLFVLGKSIAGLIKNNRENKKQDLENSANQPNSTENTIFIKGILKGSKGESLNGATLKIYLESGKLYNSFEFKESFSIPLPRNQTYSIVFSCPGYQGVSFKVDNGWNHYLQLFPKK